MLRLVVAAQRVQEFQSGNGGWLQLAVYRPDHDRLHEIQAGIAAKFASGSVNWVLAVYLINLACIGVNWIVYFRNRRLDAQREIAYEAAEA